MARGYNKRLTFEERKFIEKAKDKLGSQNIAKKLGRSPSVITKEYRDNGGRENYCAEEAQKNAEKRKEKMGGGHKYKQFIIENSHLPHKKLSEQTGLHYSTVYRILKKNRLANSQGKNDVEKFNANQLKFTFNKGGKDGKN